MHGIVSNAASCWAQRHAIKRIIETVTAHDPASPGRLQAGRIVGSN